GGAMFNRDQGVAVYGPTVAGQELVPGGLNFPGTYTITETTPPTGYNLANPVSQTVTLSSGETKTLTFIDTPVNTPTHLICENAMCKVTTGSGDNQCDTVDSICGTHLECNTSKNQCQIVANTQGNIENKDGCTTLDAVCGTTPPTVKSCETVTVAFVGGYDTHYVGDKVDITVTGKSDHANGVTSFKFRFGPEGSKVVTCGKFVRASMAENCSGISQDGDTYSTTLTYTLDKVGAFEVYGAACDDSGSDSCSEFSK
ncbi:prealbumin-like fold domain-containing protein, partial [Patescibacteria group bacterium]|nr:prealbumin-like fold domain-containing protein [Patescibacteria group bacterium]